MGFLQTLCHSTYSTQKHQDMALLNDDGVVSDKGVSARPPHGATPVLLAQCVQ